MQPTPSFNPFTQLIQLVKPLFIKEKPAIKQASLQDFNEILPQEIAQLIFEKLPCKDRLTVSLVCKKWNTRIKTSSTLQCYIKLMRIACRNTTFRVGDPIQNPNGTFRDLHPRPSYAILLKDKEVIEITTLTCTSEYTCLINSTFNWRTVPSYDNDHNKLLREWKSGIEIVRASSNLSVEYKQLLDEVKKDANDILKKYDTAKLKQVTTEVQYALSVSKNSRTDAQ